MGSVLPFLRNYHNLVVFGHTIFALPFAALGLTLGLLISVTPDYPILILQVLLAMIFARNTAMAFNRLIDAKIDERNPRTAVREIPSGKLNVKSVQWFVLMNVIAFILTAFSINFLCFLLSPVALAVIMGYSYTKRFTPLCHLVLGIGLGLAPVGAYIAVTSKLEWPIFLLGLAVAGWVAGFDIIYALQDEEFDRKHGLHSVPAWLGLKNALIVSKGFHLISFLLLTGFVWLQYIDIPANLPLLIMALIFFGGMLLYQHWIVGKGDMSKINRAFFTVNGIASLVFCLSSIIAFLFS
jgi:4-hydroxybenzoate polyprenyltransferase